MEIAIQLVGMLLGFLTMLVLILVVLFLSRLTVPNLKIVMNHVVTYFGPKECLSKQKRYLRYKMTKPCKLTTRKYVGLVRDLTSRQEWCK